VASNGQVVGARSAVEELYFPRDIGVRCGPVLLDSPSSFPWSAAHAGRSQDSYALVQVDDLANPWAFYAVAERTLQHGQLPSFAQLARFTIDLPAWLVQNPRVHQNPCRALYETHALATKAMLRAAVRPGALTMAVLREEFLNISWTGESKVVLGRLAAKASPAPEPATTPALQGPLRPASRHRPGAKEKEKQESYIGSRQMKQWMQFDGPPPILRAVDLTAQSADGVYSGDTAGGGGGAGEGQLAQGDSNRPAVRRMRLKPDDVCVVIATQGLWKWLSPEEVVTIVGQNMHRMASDATEALLGEVRRRQQPMDETGNGQTEKAIDKELTIVVIYLAGERYVKDFEIERANHLNGEHFVSEGLLPAQQQQPSGLRSCLCKGKASQLMIPGGPF
jgi:serine/threonine protein phosphatase PrpC